MTIQRNTFLGEVRRIAALPLTYRWGGRGVDGTCDCIGLIMGAMYAAGHAKYPMHSTNYFARHEMDSLEKLEGGVELGEIVYKARADTGGLNDRYKPGGRYYTGDMLDYYHVGVVTGVEPLEITHCTESAGINGIAYDSSLKGWTHHGRLKDVAYEGGEDDTRVDAYKAVVKSENGLPVKLRPTPGTEKPYIAKIAVGTVLDVTEQAQGWAKVILPNGTRGYMMSEFLEPVSGEIPEEPPEDGQEGALPTVALFLPRDVADAMYKALGEALKGA